jgi:hypothetical protein
VALGFGKGVSDRIGLGVGVLVLNNDGVTLAVDWMTGDSTPEKIKRWERLLASTIQDAVRGRKP